MFGCAVRASDVSRYEIDRGSDLEKELGYKVSVQEERDEKPSETLDKVMPIEGAAPKYTVNFHATVGGRLKDLFELNLTLTDAKVILVQGPLSLRSQSNEGNEVDVEFLIKKDLIDQAVLAIRCAPWMVHSETSYAVRLRDYAPGFEPTEAQRIAELRERHSGLGILLWHRNKNLADYSYSLTALTAAQRAFSEINFVGLSLEGLTMLLGPPDIEPTSASNSVTYTYGYNGQFVIRRFHFDSQGCVESIEKLPSR